MIKNKRDYQYYLEADRLALGRRKKNLRDIIITTFIARDEVWDFEKLLRKIEYCKNCKRGFLGRLEYALLYRRLHKRSLLLGFDIYPNNFGPGLSISHPGPIIINGAARIGANCRIHPGVTIGTQAGFDNKTASLGNNVYIGPGAKIFGEIEIADNIAIGANSVVNKSFLEPGITIAGVPARKISDKGSEGFLIKATDMIKR